MTRVIVDEATLKKLLGLREPLELCEPSGKVLGQFTPTTDPFKSRAAQPELAEEELHRREQEPEFSTEQVLAYLEKL